MQKGLLIVFTGNGKGKTTAALGMALRAAGHGMRILILQFIKGARNYGELISLKKFEEVSIQPLGTGFTWLKENLEEDRELARLGWEKAENAIIHGGYDMIILDELCYVLSYGLLGLESVLETIRHRPEHLHVVVTGRNAPEKLILEADCVTEMCVVKHHYGDQGIKSQRGIEF
ncbi:MAG: cob(I)yrinic acid a,c-diamide adenosyltransferase [Desulfoferrobacter sp.]